MQDDYTDLMGAFLRCIAVDEEFAREIAEIADQCGEDGNRVVAAAMRNVSRNHRIRGMESRAWIAAFTQQNADPDDERY